MSYLSQVEVATDMTILNRIAACAATQNIPDPQGWAWARSWQFSAQPLWAAKYASAKLTHEQWDPESEIPKPAPPGENEAAITDADILSAVQSMMT